MFTGDFKQYFVSCVFVTALQLLLLPIGSVCKKMFEKKLIKVSSKDFRDTWLELVLLDFEQIVVPCIVATTM